MKKKYQYSIIVIHIMLTFVWERMIFHFHNNWDKWTLSVRKETVSAASELIMNYALSKILAGILIVLFWKILFQILEKKYQKSMLCLFGSIFLIGVVIGALSYPETFGIEIDNYSNYSKAIRFLPNYWQSIYTGIVYTASMMVIPHPCGIFLVQWTAYVAVLAYIYQGIDRIYHGTRWKYAVVFFLFLPESYYVMLNAYRNDYYTILCLFYIAYLFFALVEKREHSQLEMCSFAMFSGFMMVWRSEGLFIGAGGMFLLLLLVYRSTVRKICLVGLCFVLSFFALNKCQGIGADKYFGQDYMIVNTTNVLYSTLNDPEVNLSYEGAEKDLEAIEAVVPLAALKEKGLTGYRSYNYSMGHGGFNQSLADDEAASAYMKAYYRIVLHNPVDYLNVQFNYFSKCMGLPFTRTTYQFKGEETFTTEKFKYSSWKDGREELYHTTLTKRWLDNPIRAKVYAGMDKIWKMYRDLWNGSGINGGLHLLFLGVDLILLIAGFFMTLIRRDAKTFGKWIISGILCAEFLAIFLFMPEGRSVYLYPMLFCSYLMSGLLLLDRGKEKNER